MKIFLDKEKVTVYNTKSMRKERLRYYEDKYIGNPVSYTHLIRKRIKKKSKKMERNQRKSLL